MTAHTHTAPTPTPQPGHAFDHPTDTGRGGQRRALGWALTVNTILLVVEVIGGIVFGSLALLADAAHLVSNVAGLGITLGAIILTARPTSPTHSFGFAPRLRYPGPVRARRPHRRTHPPPGPAHHRHGQTRPGRPVSPHPRHRGGRVACPTAPNPPA